ncbi:MAG: Hint domain-containing protein [Rhodospirillales bacterium]|nr:Hint domain-containing protein [Rhodospirillales bacterium]
MPVAITYDEYGFTLSGSTGTINAAGVTSKTITESPTNDDNILGDEQNETFTNGNKTYTYEGTVSYTAGGHTYYGFLGAINSTYTLFVPAGQTAPNGTITTDTANSSTSSGLWNLTSAAPGCFVAGTLIATPGGAVPVESLAAGDLVLTADGQARPVRWLGRSTISRFGRDPLSMLPIRIKAGALAENVPARDLLVSPGHAVLVGGVLAHAAALVNGSSIVREQDMPLVFTYYHVELDSHALLLAEGAAAESFLDGVEALGFENWDERAAVAAEELPYPRAKSARQLPAGVRAELAARAAALFGALAEAA